jgi:site-specific DNA-cytosine methylase
MLKTHSDYDDAIEKPFEQLCAAIEKGEKSRHGAVVLDCFAGVGTGIVVLKRLGIAIRKIIHVEYDLVASHVYRSNHDRAYNETLPDDGGIEHVYEYKRWEDLNEKEAMEDLLRKHGREYSKSVFQNHDW